MHFNTCNKCLTWDVLSSLNMCKRGLYSSRCSCNRTEVGKCRATEEVGTEATAGADCSLCIKTAMLCT